MTPALAPTRSLILLLAALTAMTPLAIDAYLPAIPEMAAHFNTTIHNAEISLSLFLAGFAIGQIIGGPFSDQFGRRTATGIGISLYCIGTLGIMLSHTMHQVWMFRVLEAIGGGLAVVNSAAVIRDLSQGRESARHLANISIIMMLAPLLAPLIGMFLLHLHGWQLIFQFLLGYGLIVGIALFFRLPETRQQQPDKPNVIQRYKMILTHRCAMGFVFSQWFAMSGMFAFITGSPSVYMGFFDFSETAYPFLFGVNVIGMMAANRLNVRLLHFHRPQTLLWIGQISQVVIAVLMFIYLSFSSAPSIWVIVPAIALFIACIGFIVSNATSSTVEYFPTNSATATALLGAGGFASGALSGGLVGMLGDGTPWPMVLIMMLCTLISLALRWIMQRNALAQPV